MFSDFFILAAEDHNNLLGLASVIVLGILAQWLAWRLRVPSILLLLTAGLIVGPGLQFMRGERFIDPEALFGGLLMPFVSIAVAVILFEGGLSLRMAELRRVGRTVMFLIFIGGAVTWILAGVAAHFILDLPVSLSALLGAVLVVTGPTVITPMLQHIRPVGKVSPILKWEGIVIDPVGALLAVLVFEVILSGNLDDAPVDVAIAVAKTVIGGGLLGTASALILAFLLKRFWIPDTLQSTVALAFVVASFAASNVMQEESGLFTVTVMGAVLANQKWVDIEAIAEFKEALLPLLIATLFILLAARLDAAMITNMGWAEAVFVLVLLIIVRPVAVFASTVGSALTPQERLFLSWMAPRGIVAAAVASIFALRLLDEGFVGAEKVITGTFAVIVGTVLIYGLTAPLLARRLKLAENNPQGILIAGADPWVRDLAELLKARKFRVVVVDTNRMNTSASRMAGFPTYTGSMLSEHVIEEIDFGGLGRFLSLTPNDWVNILATQRMSRVFGSANVYQIAPLRDVKSRAAMDEHMLGRVLFGREYTHMEMALRKARGYTLKATKLSEEFTYDMFREKYGEQAVVLFIIDETNKLAPVTAETKVAPTSGQTVIALVQEPENKMEVKIEEKKEEKKKKQEAEKKSE